MSQQETILFLVFLSQLLTDFAKISSHSLIKDERDRLKNCQNEHKSTVFMHFSDKRRFINQTQTVLPPFSNFICCVNVGRPQRMWHISYLA